MRKFYINYTTFSWETGDALGDRTREIEAETEMEARMILTTDMAENGISYCINDVQLAPAEWLLDIAHQKFCEMRDCPQCPYDGCWCEGTNDESCKKCTQFIRWIYEGEAS